MYIGQETTGPSDVPIAVNPANMPGGTMAVEFVPSAAFFQDFQPPFPTNTWWSGMTLGWQSNVLAGPFPFQSKTENMGLGFGVSEKRRFDGTTLHQDTAIDWVASFTGLPDDASSRKATYWDTQVVCIKYFNAGSSAQMDSCLVPGSPYMTFTFSNAAPVFTSLEGPVSDMTWVTPGSKLKVTSEVGTYIFYALEGGLNLELQGNATHSNLVSPTPYSGTIRVTKLVTSAPEDILDAHVQAVPTGVNLEYTVAGDESTQVWTWKVTGNPADLLILCYPHHR
jgi:endo-1,3(4)-beta-glucanase